jgi:hypothetical protein
MACCESTSYFPVTSSSGPVIMNSVSHLSDREEQEVTEGIAIGHFNVFGISPPACIFLAPLSFIAAANGSTVGKTITDLSFPFINSTSPQKVQNAANQKAVRSHASRQYYHRRWLQKCDIPNLEGSDSPPASAPALDLGAWNADPFGSLPIEIQPCMWLLIDHCKILSTLISRSTVRMSHYISFLLYSQTWPCLFSFVPSPQFK